MLVERPYGGNTTTSGAQMDHKTLAKTDHFTDFVKLTRVHFGSALMWCVAAPLDTFWRPLHHRFDLEFQKPYSPAVTFKLLSLFFHWILTSNKNCWRQSATQRKRHFTPLTWWWFITHRIGNTPNRFRTLDRLTNDKDWLITFLFTKFVDPE